jgi:glycosyltransferase involved in cell wall biosynthesis
MRVCHVTNFHPRLDRRIFSKECVALRDAGHEVFLIAPGGSQECEVLHGITILRGPMLHRKRDFLRNCRQIYRMARDLQADVYHLHDPFLLPFGFKAQRRLGAHVIFDAHEDYVAEAAVRTWMPGPLRRLFAWCVERYEKRAARVFDAFVVVAEDTRRRVESVGGRAVVVANYVPGESFPKEPATIEQYAARGPTILHTGALNESRGSRIMIEAAAILKRRGFDFRWLVVDRYYGDPVVGRAAVERLIRDANVEDRVEIVPEVTYDRLGEILRRGAIGISILDALPGWDVATPTKIFEYMAYTMPVVSFRLKGHQEIVEGNGAGWLFDRFSGEDLAACLALVLPDVVLRHGKGLNGFRAFREKYLWEDQAARLVELYEQLIAAPLAR